MQRRRQAVIFDLDGVLCSTDRFHYQAWKVLADRLGLPFDEAANDRLRGLSRAESLERLLAASPRRYGEPEKAAFAEEKNRTYRALLARLTPADLPAEVRGTLPVLRERGYRLAVGSSSRNAKFILGQIGLAGFFDAVADGTEIRRAKPDPEVFLLAAEKLGLAPRDCCVVEDAASGIRAAAAAGMMSFALHGSAEGCGLADVRLSSFGELLRFLP